MAYLILNSKGSPHEEPEDQTYYEFNPKNELIFNEIVSLMSQRKNGGRKIIERKLAELCAESMRKKTTNTIKTQTHTWKKTIYRFFGQMKSKKHYGRRSGTGIISVHPC